MTPLDLDELEKLARAATSGPWTCDKPPTDKDGFRRGVSIAATYGRQMIYADPPGGSFPAADQRHIAAFDPPTALALIEAAKERDTLRAQLAQAREALEAFMHTTKPDKDALEGLPDSHCFKLTWTPYEPGNYITAGQIRRARQTLAAITPAASMEDNP